MLAVAPIHPAQAVIHQPFRQAHAANGLKLARVAAGSGVMRLIWSIRFAPTPVVGVRRP